MIQLWACVPLTGMPNFPAGRIENGNADLPPERLKLSDGRRTREITRHEKRMPTPGLLQEPGELRRRRRLSGPLQSHENNRQRPQPEVEVRAFSAQKRDELVANDPRHLLRGREGGRDLFAQRLLFHSCEERFHDRQRNVGLQERQPDLPQSGFQMKLRQRSFAPQIFEDPLKTVPETFEHIAPARALSHPKTSKP